VVGEPVTGDDDLTPVPKFYRPGELTDESLSPGQVRALARDTKDDVEAIGRAVMKLATKLDRVIDLADRVIELEARANRGDARDDEQDKRLAALEAALGKVIP
jgi:hypothetical protein